MLILVTYFVWPRTSGTKNAVTDSRFPGLPVQYVQVRSAPIIVVRAHYNRQTDNLESVSFFVTHSKTRKGRAEFSQKFHITYEM
jgi:hypothetical protein